MTDRHDRIQEAAESAGRFAGLAAASWFFDGNTTDETYRLVLAGIDDGDPMILDTFPYLDLSGQWADGTTDQDVLDDVNTSLPEPFELTGDNDESDWVIDTFRDAYDYAVSEEIERMARHHCAEVES